MKMMTKISKTSTTTEGENKKVAEKLIEIGTVDDLLPQWIEFSRLGNKKEVTIAVQRFFGSENAQPEDFKNHFGVDLLQYPNYYLETGVADAPRGPYTPRRVTPILVLRQSRTGQSFSVHLFKHDGLVHDSRLEAWIDREEWDQHVHDTFAEDLKKKAAAIREKQEKLAAALTEQTDDKQSQQD